jgi:hypothetical protein
MDKTQILTPLAQKFPGGERVLLKNQLSKIKARMKATTASIIRSGSLEKRYDASIWSALSYKPVESTTSDYLI